MELSLWYWDESGTMDMAAVQSKCVNIRQIFQVAGERRNIRQERINKDYRLYSIIGLYPSYVRDFIREL
jgi:hypothetical protein